MPRPPKPTPVLGQSDATAWADATKGAKPLTARPTAPPLPRVRAVVAEPGFDSVPAVRGSQRLAFNATLDATWDRKLRTGEVQPDMIIDLHGHSQKQAFDLLQRGLVKAHRRRARLVLVITGKGDPDPATWPAPDPRRGMLRQAFPNWLETPDIAAYITSVRQAHKRHGGAGAWYVVLKRLRETGQ
jgi:DNA-nicking Smr family endonuclease